LRGDWSHAANVRGGAVAPYRRPQSWWPSWRLIEARFSAWL